MASDPSDLTRDDDAEATPTLASRAPVERGRLGVYAALGASAGALPLPWLPSTLARRVRGALVNDVASRHGTSLTPEARAVLADPHGPDVPQGFVGRAARYLGARVLARFGPLGALFPLRYATQTYVLGYLFDRYLEVSRRERSVRIAAPEALRVRRAIDGAVLRALTVEAAPIPEPVVVDDQRDPTTALVDGLMGAVAGLPTRVLRRLDAAFDELLAVGDDA
jgi:hypothetical protein